MGWFGGITEERWTHQCGGKATPGERCDYCDAKLKGSANATWDVPRGWTPPGQDVEHHRTFSIW